LGFLRHPNGRISIVEAFQGITMLE
jgi:hypothetical protein